MEPASFVFPALVGGVFFTTSAAWEAPEVDLKIRYFYKTYGEYTLLSISGPSENKTGYYK